MVQLIGRYQKLPYWRLLPGGQKDDVVIDQVLSDFYAMSQSEQLVTMQSYLHLYGYSVELTGVLDSKTKSALQEFASKNGLSNPGVDQATYIALFENIPIDHLTKQRRKIMPKETQAYAQAHTVQQSSTFTTSTPELDIAGGTIKLWTDKGEYTIGDTMMVKFSVDKPMFVRVVVINSTGEVSTLFPNVYQSDSFCKPGEVYQIPPSNGDFTLDIGEPRGTDKIRAIASNVPIEAEKLYFTSDGDFDENKMASYPIRSASDVVIH
jgi:peptidoglycan hydrolase-like protein with peptidoglycan-binding domain